MKVVRLVVLVSLVVLATAGCVGRFAPDGPAGATDAGFLGCQVGPQPGATVREGEPLAAGEPMAGVPITTLTPRQVGELALARGLRVTWRYSYGIGGANAPVPGDPPVVAPVPAETPVVPTPSPDDVSQTAEPTVPKPGGGAVAPGVAMGFSECWCQPPPDGQVTSLAYGMASELVVFVESGQVLPAPREQPVRGWGC